MQARLLLGVALLATVVLYWAGLHGPFLLDDANNLESVQRWLGGQAAWQQVVFDNHSGLFGRSLSMASFLLSGAAGGFDPFWFKLGNLAVHLGCGVLGWQVLRRVLALDPRLAGKADLIAAVLAALWLLHPIHVSTVLYVVQRMAQLSTLFVLAALWAYLAARRQLDAGRMRTALAGLFVLFPLLWLAGLLSKENAAVAPALCLVLELAYFTGKARNTRVLAMFYGLFLVVPITLAGVLLWLQPQRLLGGYAVRDFTMGERLLSQSRALIDYLGTLALPRVTSLGVYTDDFAASTGLFSPMTTALSLLALLLVSAAAIVLRKRAPTLFAGWFFFLVAHGIESSFLPLELYFEHRNYLPAFGALLAAAGALALLGQTLERRGIAPGKLGFVVAGALALGFAFGTFGKTRVWQSEATLVEEASRYHPDSLRAILAKATSLLNQGHLDESAAVVTTLLDSEHPRHRLLARINLVTIDCLRGGHGDPGQLRAAIRDAGPKLTLAEADAFELLADVSSRHQCAIGPPAIADSIDRIVDAATAQPDSLTPKWQLRHIASRLYARAGLWDDALPQARLAWQPTAAPAVGGFLIRVYVKNGMREEAERTYREVAERIGPNDRNGQAGLTAMRQYLDATDPASASAPTRNGEQQ